MCHTLGIAALDLLCDECYLFGEEPVLVLLFLSLQQHSRLSRLFVQRMGYVMDGRGHLVDRSSLRPPRVTGTSPLPMQVQPLPHIDQALVVPLVFLSEEAYVDALFVCEGHCDCLTQILRLFVHVFVAMHG